jgi:methyltransferase-like protein
VEPLRMSSRAGDLPTADAFARHQATQPGVMVTNLRHENVTVDDVARVVLRQLDGRNDRTALKKALLQLAAEGQIQISIDGKGVEAPDLLDKMVGQLVEEKLSLLAQLGLLLH